jgi:hypothetical protein
MSFAKGLEGGLGEWASEADKKPTVVFNAFDVAVKNKSIR